jgi:sugar-specific transcriptional regulator TrmB
MHEERLKELGLTQNEVSMYLLLLRQDAMSPSEIAEKLGLHRGYVYDALERMQEKGAVNSMLKNNRRFFQATSPENLVEMLKLRLENFERIVPELMKMREAKKEDTRVELHKGKRVYRTLLKDIISTVRQDEEVYLIGIDENALLTEVEPLYLRQYLNIIKKRNIRERSIIRSGSKKIRNPNLQYRELDGRYIGKTAQLIYGNKVANVILGSPYYLVLIENKDVAETNRKQFELLWKVAN